MGFKIYDVRDKRDGHLIVRGGAEECAKTMGVTYGSFLTIVNRASRGCHTRYTITSEDEKISPSAVESWNQKIYLPNKFRVKSDPCVGCPWKSLCLQMDSYCSDWAQWYAFAFNRTTKKFK